MYSRSWTLTNSFLPDPSVSLAIPMKKAPHLTARELPLPGMAEGELFFVNNDELHSLTTLPTLDPDALSALQNDLGVTVGETILPIAHWEHTDAGPLSVALNFAGELVVVVMAEGFDDQRSLLSTLGTLEQWLAPMDLQELGELSGNQSRFNEGLAELSSTASLTLASMLRVMLINTPFELSAEPVRSALPFCRVEHLRIEAFRAADQTLTIRRHISPLQTTTQDRVVAEEPPVIHLDSPPSKVINLDDDVVVDDQVIDLNEPPEPERSPAGRAVGYSPTIIRGSTYRTEDLPLSFDPTGRAVEPISDELFAVGPHLALVVDLDDFPESPLETSSIFRWGATDGARELFDRFCTRPSGITRTIHLFVESRSQPNRVLYLGVVEQLPQSERSTPATLWFQLGAPVEAHRLADLQAGRLPDAEANSGRSFSFATSHSATTEPPQHAPLPRRSNWIPNV